MRLFVILAVLLFAVAAQAECKKHVELLSTDYWVKNEGMTVQQAHRYKLNIWEKSNAQGKGRVVGKIRVGSRALILAEGKDSYKILSPLDKSIGWISKIQVAGTRMQDTVTRRRCR